MTKSVCFIHNSKPYEVNVRRERRKDLRLKIKPPGVIIAAMPLKADLKVLEDFLERRRAEIEHYLDRLSVYEGQMPTYKFCEGDIITFAAQPLKIVVDPLKAGCEVKAVVDEDLKEIRLMSGTKPVNAPAVEYEKQAALAVQEALMTCAKRWFTERAAHFGQQMSLSPKLVKISRAKTRYGSCSSRGNINFCWRILLAPAFVADYIVVHELAHLAHLNHSKAFYALVEKTLPAYKEAQAWLKTNGALLEWPV